MILPLVLYDYPAPARSRAHTYQFDGGEEQAQTSPSIIIVWCLLSPQAQCYLKLAQTKESSWQSNAGEQLARSTWTRPSPVLPE